MIFKKKIVRYWCWVGIQDGRHIAFVATFLVAEKRSIISKNLKAMYCCILAFEKRFERISIYPSFFKFDVLHVEKLKNNKNNLLILTNFKTVL